MNWFTALTLRLFVGSSLGFLITLLISYFGLARTESVSSVVLVYLLLLGPLVLMLILGFLIPNWILNHRWQKIWKPRAEGKLSVPVDKREQLLFKGVREITGVWALPNKAKIRLEEYLTTWAHTLVRDRVHEPLLYEVLALGWYVLHTDKELLLGIRSLLMEMDELDDAAFDVGLSVLTERETDVDLAILLAKAGLERDWKGIAAERHVLLENAYLAAYAKDEELRPHLLPILTRRFLKQQRRDEVAGRIYLDAFIAGERDPLLREEMKRTSDVMARTGRSPEMTANLRALSEAGKDSIEEGAGVGTILRAPSTWSSSPARIATASGKKASPSPAVRPEKKSVGEQKPLPAGTSGKRRTALVWIVIVVVLLLIVAGSYFYFYHEVPAEVADEPELVPVTQPLLPVGEVRSDLPYTLQIAAFQAQDAAVDKIRSLREADVDAYYVINEKNDLRWYRIRIGRFASTREATLFADSLRGEGVIQEYYVATFEQGIVPEEAVE